MILPRDHIFAGLPGAEVMFDGGVTLFANECIQTMARLPEASIDACVTDAPYHLQSIHKRFAKVGRDDKTWSRSGPHQRTASGFMNQKWDGGDIAFRAETWAAVYRVLKPGAHLAAFGGTRTFHRMMVAIEDAGFELRDTLMWVYGSGFPKSHDVSKGIDRAAGAERKSSYMPNNGNAVYGKGMGGGERNAASDPPATVDAREWQGWGTALKPAWEPIALFRKPLSEGTVAANVLRWGTGALNIDGCRVETEGGSPAAQRREVARRTGNAPTAERLYGTRSAADHYAMGKMGHRESPEQYMRERPGETLGRWPANLVHDGSDEVLAAFPEARSSGGGGNSTGERGGAGQIWGSAGIGHDSTQEQYSDSGSSARFFYTAKADADDRLGSKHPTVKPLDLMQWLVRLVTPPGGTVLDCFAGTGTTGEAAWREGMRAVLIEAEPEYQDDIRRRMRLAATAGLAERERESIKARGKLKTVDGLPLFATLREAAE